ncbi:hypothetical protein OESDEN_21204 [Oesophagostomum dentatum]|uniref:SCP domain-containing protein n=1 Tax=Oesophagostomum dentatum TaxID=61180 RepID=A0A0B1S6R4_OESDE|nr:hypothetical protein OESDEN_21204 [Oesophagostomum dentatum]
MFRANHVGTPITSFTQMAWATSNRLGCSIARCASDIVAVCRYLEKGNIVEKNVYVPGNTCASCRNNCVSSLGLCI